MINDVAHSHLTDCRASALVMSAAADHNTVINVRCSHRIDTGTRSSIASMMMCSNGASIDSERFRCGMRNPVENALLRAFSAHATCSWQAVPVLGDAE